MVLTCSPQQEATTLRFASPSHLHHLDAGSTLLQLRRSLSKSPSKSPAFRLFAGRSGPSLNSPLAPLSASPRRSSNRLQVPSAPNEGSRTPSPIPSPLGQEFPNSARGPRQSVRKYSPLRSGPRPHAVVRPQSSKRVLGESSDAGNAAPVFVIPSIPSSRHLSGDMGSSKSIVQPPKATFKGFGREANAASPVSASEKRQPPQSPFSFRNDKHGLQFDDMPIKSSPLKRTDAPSRNDPLGVTSPSAKRRSLHGSSDFSIFDSNTTDTMLASVQTSPVAITKMSYDKSSVSSPVSKRAGTLRKSTLQQRIERPSLIRAKASSNLIHDFSAIASTPGSIMRRDSNIARNPLPTRRNLFANEQQDSVVTSTTPPPPTTATPAVASSLVSHDTPTERLQAPPRHPLSRTITQSSSGSDVAQDSPTHVPIRAPPSKRNPGVFARSLPIGIERKGGSLANSSITAPGEQVAETPDNYKLAKPLQAVFHSTGLISKRTKDLRQDSIAPVSSMPDTPCKRPMPANPMAPSATPAPPPRHTQLRRNMHAFGTPSTPFGASVSRPPPGANGQGVGIFGSTLRSLNRRGSFLSVGSDDNMSDAAMAQSSELPATPSKVNDANAARFMPRGSVYETRPNGDDAANNDADTVAGSPKPTAQSSPLFERIGHRSSPHTPKDFRETVAPPDPSGLSISAQCNQLLDFKQSTLGRSFGHGSIPPATPTANRESSRFQSHRLAHSSAHAIVEAQLDPSLTSRFDDIEMIGDGEFSSVFRVVKWIEGANNAATDPSYFQRSGTDKASSGETSHPGRVYAVKKSRNAYLGQKDRLQKLQEVEVLRALGHSGHTIELFDHWEHEAHLYIQTEFCEEGSLDRFLVETGQSARLDDFRIWKILLEISKGLKHVHDSGFMHLDLKPANVLITFNGALKIADFGMASSWPAAPGLEAEGDREYIGPEILVGSVDKPSDIFALGLIVFEIAGNVVLPDNGASWQRLRQGDISDVPSLTSNSDGSVSRNAKGLPIGCDIVSGLQESGNMEVESGFSSCEALPHLLDPPSFMVDSNHRSSLESIVTWMINPKPLLRPTVDELLHCDGCSWVEDRRRSPATIYEGTWGPQDNADADAEMMDV